MITSPNFDATGFNSLYLALQQEAQDRNAGVTAARNRIEPKLLTYSSTGTQNDVDTAGSSIIYLTPASALSITGFRAPDLGRTRILWLYNAGSGIVTIKSANAGSATLNQIIGPMAGAIDYIMVPGMALQLAYISSRWRAVGTQDGLWQSFTPSYTGFTLGNGSNFARYTTIGANTFFYVTTVLGSTSSFSGSFVITSLPTTNEQNAATMWMGSTIIYDSSAGVFYWGTASVSGANGLVAYADSGAAGGTIAGITATNPITFATSDQITVQGWWRTV